MKLSILVYFFLLKISFYLEKISSTIIFLAIYFCVLAPMGIVMRLCGYNAMKSKQKGSSFFIERNKLFSSKDLETPF